MIVETQINNARIHSVVVVIVVTMMKTIKYIFSILHHSHTVQLTLAYLNF